MVQRISWSYFMIGHTLMIDFHLLRMPKDIENPGSLQSRLLRSTFIVGRRVREQGEDLMSKQTLGNEFEPAVVDYLNKMDKLAQTKLQGENNPGKSNLQFKKLEVFNMYSSHGGNDSENNVLHEVLFEDVNGLQLAELRNDTIVGKEFFYKPSYFDGSRCEITKDYIACSARMEVGEGNVENKLIKKSFLLVWKKKKIREDHHHGFTYHIIELSDKISAKRAFVVEDYSKNCVTFIAKGNIVKTGCFDINQIKLKFTDKAIGKNIKELHFKVIANDFKLNKTSKNSVYIHGGDFLHRTSPPKSHIWLIVILVCILILAISLCIL
jgi:hypothetical protein